MLSLRQVSKVVVMAAMVGVGSRPAAMAQYSKTFDACMARAMTQLSMHKCADTELARANYEWQERYKRALLLSTPISGATDALKKSERVWNSYREAYLRALHSRGEYAYGTMGRTESQMVLAKLTIQHVKDLDDLISRYRQALANAIPSARLGGGTSPRS